MWPGRAVSLIDRPWSRVLRLRGRTSLARGPTGEGGHGTEGLDGSQNAICRYTGSTGPSGGDVSKLVGTHYPR